MTLVPRAALVELRERAAGIARSFIGVTEASLNSGPLIDDWLKRVGRHPGDPWCMAFVLGCCYWTAWEQIVAPVDGKPLAAGEIPLPMSGSCARFWARVPEFWRSPHPSPYAIAIHLKDPKDKWSPGHTGIVLSIGGDHVTTCEGNTNEAGSREGDCVAEKIRRLDYWHGFVDVARVGPNDDTPAEGVRVG